MNAEAEDRIRGAKDLMNEYRITKYIPSFRESAGAYSRDEWVSVRDIGRSFGSVALTSEQYERFEGAYVEAAFAFLREAGVYALRVESLENHHGYLLNFREGSLLPLEQIGDVLRRVLREEFWCRLNGVGGFVHVGWDFYMYVGVRCPCPAAQVRATELGLYVEETSSPYNEQSGT
jgi:hypothetical protein